MGKIAFGTSPANAEIRVTLRSFESEDMASHTTKAENIITQIANNEKLKVNIEYSEIFPALVNDKDCVELIKNAVRVYKYDFIEIENPFKWSEDFGYCSEKYKGGFFGLGSGMNQDSLHHPQYDFPDDILATGINIFYQIYKSINF